MLIFILLILFGLPFFLTMSCGIIFSIILLIILNFKDYTEPILLSIDMVSLHAPVASWHSPTIFSLFIIGIIGYTVLRLKKITLPLDCLLNFISTKLYYFFTNTYEKDY